MSVYQDKKTGLWRYDFERGGRRFTGRGKQSETKARDAEYARRRELDKGLTDPFPTFADLVNAWIASASATMQRRHVKQVERSMNTLFPHLAKLRPKHITRGHIEPALMRFARHRKPNTVNNYRKDIVAILNYGVKLGALPYNVASGIPHIPDDGERRKPVPTPTLKALILAADPDLWARLVFCSQTGCRWVEMARLRWEEVRLEPRATALLTTRKRRGGSVFRRVQPLTPLAVRAIEQQRGADTEYVFPAPYGGAAAYATDKLHLDLLCKHVGRGRWGWHQIRHWAGTTVAKMGKNRRAIADLLGQASVSATDRYIHAAAEEVWEMAGELERELNLGAPVAGLSAGHDANQRRTNEDER